MSSKRDKSPNDDNGNNNNKIIAMIIIIVLPAIGMIHPVIKEIARKQKG